MSSDTPVCRLCGEPMPPGEEMFKYHGYSGPCPKNALPQTGEDRKQDLIASDVPSMARILHRIAHDDEDIAGCFSCMEGQLKMMLDQRERDAVREALDRIREWNHLFSDAHALRVDSFIASIEAGKEGK